MPCGKFGAIERTRGKDGGNVGLRAGIDRRDVGARGPAITENSNVELLHAAPSLPGAV